MAFPGVASQLREHGNQVVFEVDSLVEFFALDFGNGSRRVHREPAHGSTETERTSEKNCKFDFHDFSGPRKAAVPWLGRECKTDSGALTIGFATPTFPVDRFSTQ